MRRNMKGVITRARESLQGCPQYRVDHKHPCQIYSCSNMSYILQHKYRVVHKYHGPFAKYPGLIGIITTPFQIYRKAH